MTLTQYLSHWSQQAYHEGRHDCGLFIARWVDLQLGTHYADEMQESYRTIHEGLRKYAPQGISKRVQEELVSLGCQLTKNPEVGAVVLLENGFCALWDGQWGVGPILGMTGCCCIHRRHARAFINLPQPQNA